MAPKTSAEQILKLPPSVVSRLDTAHIARELEVLDEYLNQHKLRPDSPQVSEIKLSERLDDLAQLNELNL